MTRRVTVETRLKCVTREQENVQTVQTDGRETPAMVIFQYLLLLLRIIIIIIIIIYIYIYIYIYIIIIIICYTSFSPLNYIKH